ncbi:glycosyltransferase family 4 protein [Schlesneria sp.]|uniref:glycosyltransferase family 4 protein n=1 Tax=Schlesneria sp. TaxID=2762018 RepID=UPI002F201492
MSEIEPSVLLFAGPFAVRGSCSYSLRLAEHLSAYGLRSTLACPDAGRVEPERRRELQIREFSHLQLPLWGCVVVRMMLQQLKLDPPDLIHIQSRNVAHHGMWLARELKRPFVLTMHDYLQPWERLAIDRRWCRRIIAVSESVKRDLMRRTGLPDDLITVIHSGVDTNERKNELSVLGTDRVPVVGAAGPLEEVKGFPFFLSAAARVLAQGRDVEFVIAGAGPEESKLRRLALDLKIDSRVTFVPNLLEFGEAIAAMDIFCLPSLQQGIGTIMLEAMALGRPVIATRVGGVDRVIRNDETGFLVPPSNSTEMADRIMELLDSPDKARSIGRAGRLEVEREFSVNQMVSRTAELYREILDRKEPVVETESAIIQHAR